MIAKTMFSVFVSIIAPITSKITKKNIKIQNLGFVLTVFFVGCAANTKVFLICPLFTTILFFRPRNGFDEEK